MDLSRLKPRDVALTINNVFMWVAEVLLALRVVLRLFSVDEATSFAKWVYQTSDSLLEPIRWLFPSPATADGAVIDIPALFAMVVYALLALLVVMLVGRLGARR